MKRKPLRQWVADPRFIPGVYNYCDRWCERCALSNRCRNYAMEKESDDGDPEARDLANDKFWRKLHETFQETLEFIRAEAKERGIDLEASNFQADPAQEQAERRRAARRSPLARAAMAYSKAVDQWMNAAKPAFAAKIAELETQLNLEIGDPQTEAAQLSDFTDVIRWYQQFIFVKLCRAIDSRAYEELETDEEIKRLPKDSDGSAKVALIAIDRSIAAWSGLRAALGAEDGDGVLNLLATLAAIRRDTEQLFPQARAFVRPGFDEPRAADAK